MLTQVAKKATEASSEKKWEFPVFEIRNRNENIFIREMKRERQRRRQHIKGFGARWVGQASVCVENSDCWRQEAF